jgi:hypothetical protein
METIEKVIENLEEELAKGPNYWKDKDPKKYQQMLNKLKRARKTPGHKERATQQVLQAKRRERGGKGTTAGQDGKSGHSKGHMKESTGSAKKKFQNSEKKANTKLSIDRKDNDKGYESGNTRNVPQKLNRGHHKVDSKKLKEWKDKLKKSAISDDDFITLLTAKALEMGDNSLADTIRLSSFERIMEVLELKE